MQPAGKHKSIKKDCQPGKNSRDVMVGFIFNVYFPCAVSDARLFVSDEQYLVLFQCLIHGFHRPRKMVKDL